VRAGLRWHLVSMASSSRPSSAARVFSIVGAAVLAFAALLALGVGAVSLWGNGQRDRDGFVNTDREPVSTTSYALTSDDVNIDTGLPNWAFDRHDYSRVRLSAQSVDGKPVFVGVARTSDVDRYLGGVAHATVTDFESSPFRVSYDEHSGSKHPLIPAGSPIWTASTHGIGEQHLDWKVRDGNWTVVVMNADGSPGVHTEVSAGARLSFLATLGWTSLGGGLVLLMAAGGLLYLGVRPPRIPPAAPAPTPVTA
jgi:hypothetical protein